MILDAFILLCLVFLLDIMKDIIGLWNISVEKNFIGKRLNIDPQHWSYFSKCLKTLIKKFMSYLKSFKNFERN